MKKIILGSIILFSTSLPTVALISCGVNVDDYIRGNGNDISYIQKGFKDNQDAHKNIMSSYFNATDMLAALGHYPDLISKSSDGTLYSDYLKDFIGKDNTSSSNSLKNTGKYEIKPAPKILDGKVVDREEIKNAQISTLLLNEWERVDENKFVGIVPALIYTSMADGHARYNDENFSIQKINPWSLNVFEAFEMFAKGLDRSYKNKGFLTKAQTIIKSVKDNISILNKKLQIKNKSILVLEVSRDPVSKKINIKLARTAGVYTLLYSKKAERGIGYSFPTPKNHENLKIDGFSVRAIDQGTFVSEFSNSSDEIIVLNNPQSQDFDYIKNNAKSSVSIRKILKATSDANTNIHVLNRDEFYDTVWGIYGANKFLINYSNEFNINIKFNNIEAFNTKRELEKLR